MKFLILLLAFSSLVLAEVLAEQPPTLDGADFIGNLPPISKTPTLARTYGQDAKEDSRKQRIRMLKLKRKEKGDGTWKERDAWVNNKYSSG